MRRLHALTLVLPVLLGGCLLPQPDTPPVGPWAQTMSSGAAPNSRTSAPAKTTAPTAPAVTTEASATTSPAPTFATPSDAAGTAVAASAQPQPTPGTLGVKLAGEAVSEVIVTPLAGGPPYAPTLVDGGFTLELPPGGYTLDLGGGREVTVAVKSAQTTSVTVTVTASEVTVTYQR